MKQIFGENNSIDMSNGDAKSLPVTYSVQHLVF